MGATLFAKFHWMATVFSLCGASLMSLLICALALASGLVRRILRSHPPLPPGPTPKFISGNLHQLPSTKPWLTFLKWSEKYGPIVSYRIFSRRIVVLNSPEIAADLLEGRSLIYSDRPVYWMVRLAGRALSVFWVSSSHPRFKKYRKLLHSGLNPRAVESYYDVLKQQSVHLMRDLVIAPGAFASHIDKNGAAVILRLAYGYEFAKFNESFTSAVARANNAQIQLLKPGWLVEFIPLLRFVPVWFPGAGFQRLAMRCKAEMSQIEAAPFAWAKAQIESGKFLTSFTSQQLHLLDSCAPDIAEEEEIVKWCSAALYAGGADTIPAALKTFFLSMALHPEIQERARSEIDRVVGRDRLPDLKDQCNLAYVSAILKEILRWAPVGPLGLPHCVTEHDVYARYKIPRGATVIANIWAFTHDPAIYSDPTVFSPERFLGDDAQLDPRKFVFGFGRRVCPGQHFAQASLFQTMTHVLAVFNITKAVDEHGIVVEPVIDFTSGLASHPMPFKCRITPRSTDALELLRATSDV